MKIVSYNINHKTECNEIESKINVLKKIIEDNDIIVLQELSKELLKSLQNNNCYDENKLDYIIYTNNKNAISMVAIIVNKKSVDKEIISSCEFYLKDKDEQHYINKYCEVKIGNLNILGIHRAYGKNDDKEYGRYLFDELDKYIKNKLTKNEKILICGDFNINLLEKSGTEREFQEKFLYLTGFIMNNGLYMKNTFDEMFILDKCYKIEKGNKTKVTDKKEPTNNKYNTHIDYILASSNITLKDFIIDKSIEISDHFPLKLEIIDL